MKKNINRGFMLIETLVVTTFVVGVLIFLYIQLTNLSQNYDDTYNYNTVDGVYALRNVRDYIKSDTLAFNYIKENIESTSYIDISNCDIFTDKEYCLKLFELQNIDKIFVSTKIVNKELFFGYDDDFKKFINRIGSSGDEEYRLIAIFNTSAYATIRFGDE